MNRRRFLQSSGTALAATVIGGWPAAGRGAEPPAAEPTVNRDEVRRLIDSHRPSRLARLPAGFNDRVGATHVAGLYHLGRQPFLLEGAEKLLELGTRLGKFWFNPGGIESKYPFHSQWGKYRTLSDLARSDYFQQLLARPFKTIVLESQAPAEESWRRPGLPESFYQRVTQEYYDLTRALYRSCRERDLTIVLQHWEGDWLLRGRGGELWKQPPDDWRQRCEWMVRWLAARQAGVTKARTEMGRGAKCRVAHAAEVNRVHDAWQGIPTMTQYVLPQVELDLVSYSSYDGMSDPILMWKCIAYLKQQARTGSLFGAHAVFIGEIGIPENDQPQRLTERWDELMGVFLATGMKYVIQWELFCNEFSRQAPQPRQTPITNPAHARGFWLVKPDGSLSETGKYFNSLWQRAT